MSRDHVRLPGALAAGALIVLATPASAQFLPPQSSITFNRYVDVRERQFPGYEQPGIPIGAFTLSPEIDTSAQYTDNLFASPNNGRSDVFLRVAPSARLQSNWVNRSLTISADGTIDRYASTPSENIETLNVSAYGTQDLGDQIQVRLIGRYLDNRESRESENSFALTRRPIRYTAASGALGVSKLFGSVLLDGEAGIESLNYRNGQLFDGTVVNQNYRDGTVQQYRGRADVIQSPSLAYFTQLTYSNSSYSQRTPLGVERGAATVEALAGARFELPVLVRGEIGLGYITSSNKDNRLRRFSGFAINSSLKFFPTQLTTVTLTGVRSVNDAGTYDSSTYVTLVGGLQIDHEVRRLWIFGVSLSAERDNFNGVDRRDRRLSVGASVDYRLNRLISVRGSFDRLDLSSSGTARYRSFVRDRALVGVGVKL